MSECMECGRDMHPADAAQWEYCHMCRKALQTPGKVKTMRRQGMNEFGRKAISSQLLSGAADGTGLGDLEREDNLNAT